MTSPPDNDPRLAAARERMLRGLRREIYDARVIDAMASVPRERFVPAELQSLAYDDRALGIGAGQTISQPLIVAMMAQALEIAPTDRVLEVGTGSGYQAAVLSRLAREVITVERVDELRVRAEHLLRDLNAGNVRVHAASDLLGRPEGAPYDCIVVAAGAPHIPRPVVDQLADGGRLVLPVGSRRAQQLIRVRRSRYGLELTRLGPCAFVPLIGAGAWPQLRDRMHTAP